MRHLKQFSTFILAAVLLSCASSKSTSILYSDNYDNATDRTSVMIFPYGKVDIPGKWTKIRENAISGQYTFIGVDSVHIAVALQPWDKYEFSYNNSEITPDNFVKKFYEWDANYLKEQTGGQIKIVKEQKEKNYLIWSLSNGQMPQDYFLFGLKGKIAHNLSIISNQWDEDRKVKFLEQVFEQ